jgi:hypothetical protein
VLVRIVEVASAVLLVVIVALALTRRARNKTDSIGRYSRAVSALRTIATASREEPTVVSGADRPRTERAVHVLSETAPGGRNERARDARPLRRRASRLAPEVVDQRPVIAQLPSVSAARPPGTGEHAG